jgi:CRP/FNR family transcriptional regulator
VRGADIQRPAGDFALPLTRKEISEMLGLTVETVSRTMTRFRRAGLVRTARGSVRVLDAEKLRALADGAYGRGRPAPPWRGDAPLPEAKIVRYVRKTGTG